MPRRCRPNNSCATANLHFPYQRRKTREIVIGDPARGGVIIGGNHPVVMQSMLTCDTMDTAECVKQTLELVAVGCQLVRITAPTVKDAANLQNIVAELAQAKLSRADRGRHPFQARSRDGSREMGRGRPRQSRQLRRLEEIRHQGIHRRTIRRRIEAHRGEIRAARHRGEEAQALPAHRHEPRLAFRPHHEPLRRHAAGHGRKRAGIRPHLPQARLPQLQVLDEVVQSQGDDRVLPPARGAAGTGRARIGIIRFISASPRPAKARMAASSPPSASAPCSATDSATPSASRSRKIRRAKSKSAAICWRRFPGWQTFNLQPSTFNLRSTRSISSDVKRRRSN